MHEKDVRRARKFNMAITLRETLTKQAEAKQERKRTEQSQDAVFKYQFPFIEELQQPFLISPKKYHDEEELNKILNQEDFHKGLPMQHDLQYPQYAHRILKDHQKAETVKNA